MTPGYDIIAQAQPQPCTKACRLGRKEGLKYFIQHFLRNSVSIISNPYFDTVVVGTLTQPFGGYNDGRFVAGDILPLPFTHRIKGIVDQIQQHPSYILLYNINLSDTIVKISFK